jgi:uncharacterized Fe-S cluster protein YjdI
VAAKDYRAGDVVVSYDPDVCIHAAECVRNLPAVFDPDARPWIRPENAPAERIADVVALCPSGALQFRRMEATPKPAAATTITPLPNGPLIVEGAAVVKSFSGTVLREATRVALCRCGNSKNKPFCDGSHSRVGFQAE